MAVLNELLQWLALLWLAHTVLVVKDHLVSLRGETESRLRDEKRARDRLERDLDVMPIDVERPRGRDLYED